MAVRQEGAQRWTREHVFQVEADLFDQGLDIITPRCVF